MHQSLHLCQQVREGRGRQCRYSAFALKLARATAPSLASLPASPPSACKVARATTLSLVRKDHLPARWLPTSSCCLSASGRKGSAWPCKGGAEGGALTALQAVASFQSQAGGHNLHKLQAAAARSASVLPRRRGCASASSPQYSPPPGWQLPPPQTAGCPPPAASPPAGASLAGGVWRPAEKQQGNWQASF